MLLRKLRNKFLRKFRNIRYKYLKSNECIIKTEFGYKLQLNLNKDVDRRFYFLNFENDNINIFSKILDSGMVVIDVGANIGIYSLTAAKKIGPNGYIYAFEPSDWAYNRIKKNIELNNIGNIKVEKMALCDFTGESKFHICEDDAYNSLGNVPIIPIKNTVNVKVTSIDEYCKNNNIRRVDVIKVDTEGADFLVLKGSSEILQKYSPIIFCEYNKYVKDGYNYSLNEFEEYLKIMNYSLFESKRGKLIRFDAKKSEGQELICLKDSHINVIGMNYFE